MDKVTFVFDGMQNFRDLGGLTTPDGRKVKRGMLFRSGDLSRVGHDEQAFLNKLNIDKLIDFRSEEEKDGKPSLRINGATVIPIPIENGAFTKNKIMGMITQGDKSALDEMLFDTNRLFVTEFIHEFSSFIKHVEDGGPVLFHCTAGKDRTGFAAMLVLSALGVDRETILTDYLASNQYLSETIEQTVAFANAKGMDGEMLRPLMLVKREYIEAAWDEIDNRFGGMNRYLTENLNADIEKLRSIFLEN